MEQNKEWVENFWSTGYVIRLGKDQYFQKIKDKRIVTAKIWKAAFFQSLKEAEMFAQRYLWYAGMNPQICYRGWILVSVGRNKVASSLPNNNRHLAKKFLLFLLQKHFLLHLLKSPLQHHLDRRNPCIWQSFLHLLSFPVLPICFHIL